MHDITGQRKAAFELEGHGREKLLQEIDVSRTVGWFTNSYPVVFEYSEDIAKLVVGVKEKARAIPNKGMGYGFIRREMEEVNAPDILFNYVGEFDGFNEQTTGELHVESGPEVAPENVYSEDIQLNGGIADGVLTFMLGYNAGRYSDSFIDRLCSSIQSEMIAITDFCSGQTDVFKTKSDFGVSDLDDEEFDEIANMLDLF